MIIHLCSQWVLRERLRLKISMICGVFECGTFCQLVQIMVESFSLYSVLWPGVCSVVERSFTGFDNLSTDRLI